MIFRSKRTRPFHWLRLGIERGQMAGRVSIGPYTGSGFVIDGNVVSETFSGLPLFFTARHVIPGDFRSLPKDVSVRFDALTEHEQGGYERMLGLHCNV
jgi:hypothetical protein